MKKIVGGILFLIAFLLFPQVSLGVDFPVASGFVNDFAGILKQESARNWKRFLKILRRKQAMKLSLQLLILLMAWRVLRILKSFL